MSVITRHKAILGRATLNGVLPPVNSPGFAGVHLVVFGLVAVFVAMSCCGAVAPAKPADVDYYTCTMHPSVKLQNPDGKCPICNMDLVAVLKRVVATNSADDSAPGEFTVPLKRQQQIGVTYATVARGPLSRSVRAVGKVAYDKQRHWELVARAEGYIQKLQISSRGEWVEKSTPLMVIDSPALLMAQEDLLELLRSRDAPKPARPAAAAAGIQKHAPGETRKESSLTGVVSGDENPLQSARRRLILWGFSRNQLAELEQSRVARDTITLFAPHQGVVLDLPVEQGQQVNMGDRLVDIVDLSTVWVWAEFYEDELAMLKIGLTVTISCPSYPGEKFDGKISVVDPFINDARRTARARIDVVNHALKLLPEMYVDTDLTVDMGEGIILPVGAVLQTGNHNIVFVDKGGGKLEPRFIELGRKYGNFYEIKNGLKEGERVVGSANFLIDAEAKVQGALKSW